MSKTYWLDSNTGSDDNDGTFTSPLATMNCAVMRCSNGDSVRVMRGHVESLSMTINKNICVASHKPNGASKA